MITIGVDPHKRLHVAWPWIKPAGRLANGAALTAQMAGRAWPPGLPAWVFAQWGIEGAWNYGRGLAQQLSTSVSPSTTSTLVGPRFARYSAQARQDRQARRSRRRSARSTGVGPLPRVMPEDQTVLLDLLTTERESAVAEARASGTRFTLTSCRSTPSTELVVPGLEVSGLDALQTPLAAGDRALQRQRASVVRQLAQRLQLAASTGRRTWRSRSRNSPTASFFPLTRLCGVNLHHRGNLAAILGTR